MDKKVREISLGHEFFHFDPDCVSLIDLQNDQLGLIGRCDRVGKRIIKKKK